MWSIAIFPPERVMKMDIEGSERDVIADMIFSARFQYVNSIMVDSAQRLDYLHSYKNRYIPVKIRHYTLNCSMFGQKVQNGTIHEVMIKSLRYYLNIIDEHHGKCHT